jgi:O-antigen ligase
LMMIGARSLMIYTFLLLLLPAVLGLPRGPAGHLPVYRSQVQVLLVVTCVLAATSMIMLVAEELPWTLRRLTKLFETDGENVGLLENRRFFLYWVALLAWDKAVFFGHGIASFPLILGIDPAKRSFPHNVLLETFSELGLVGGLLLLLVLALCLWPLRLARLRAEPLLLACTMIALLSLLYSMVSGDLPSLDYALLFFGLARLRPAAAEAALSARSGRFIGFAPNAEAAVHDMGDGPSSWRDGADGSAVREAALVKRGTTLRPR